MVFRANEEVFYGPSVHLICVRRVRAMARECGPHSLSHLKAYMDITSFLCNRNEKSQCYINISFSSAATIILYFRI